MKCKLEARKGARNQERADIVECKRGGIPKWKPGLVR